MKLTAVILTTFVASLALAHIEPGIYTGKTEAGEACTLESIEQHFENGQAHPLNERVTVKVNGETYVVGHPPAVDTTAGTAFFNHNVLQSEVPTPTGAKALAIAMSHEEGHEGPTSYALITHNWKTNEHQMIKCLGLSH